MVQRVKSEGPGEPGSDQEVPEPRQGRVQVSPERSVARALPVRQAFLALQKQGFREPTCRVAILQTQDLPPSTAWMFPVGTSFQDWLRLRGILRRRRTRTGLRPSRVSGRQTQWTPDATRCP